MTKYIGVLSGKGGVGKTTVAINLTTALSLLGRDVILCDADLTKANVSLHLGAHRFKTTLHEVLWQQATIQRAIYYHQSGIRFIPGGISSYHAKNTNPEMIKGLKSHGDGLAEAIILDGPVSDAKTVNAFLSLLDELILVTTPDLPALTDTLRVLHLAEQHKITILGVVINRIHFNEFELEKAPNCGFLFVFLNI